MGTCSATRWAPRKAPRKAGRSGSLTALIAFYSLLLVVEMYLMIKFARLGPSSLHSGRYHFEQQQPAHA